MLGSSRTIVQDGATVPCYDADFYPFGGEHVVANTCPQNYKFEGKERDAETGNDDFGARYYSSRFGRWLSADWSAVPAPVPYANLTNPQTLNLYAMVSDNPETFADLDGHYACHGSSQNCTLLREALANVREAAANLDKGSKEQKALNKVLKFYGKEGKDNGVTVTFQRGGAIAGGTVTENGHTTVSLSLKAVFSDPVFRQNGASADTEAAAQATHEGEHGVTQQEHGMPQNKAQEKAGELDAYTVQSYVNKGEQDNSAYGLWTVQGGFNPAAVNDYANQSTAAWCQEGGNCQ